MNEKAIVIGAGIAGLTAAFRLKEAGFDVTVLEADDHVGGRMATIERDGFLLDTAAAILPTTYTQMVKLIADAGLSGETVPTSDLVGIVREGTTHRIRGGRAVADALATRLLSVREKLPLTKLLVDLVRAGDRLDWYDLGRAADLDTETARQYADRRLSTEILEWIIDPALGACSWPRRNGCRWSTSSSPCATSLAGRSSTPRRASASSRRVWPATSGSSSTPPAPRWRSGPAV